MYLVLFGIGAKQKYIFSSNTLRENIGASLIIEQITTEKTAELLEEKNIVFSGGGNSLCVFNDEERAKQFVNSISEWVLKTYPGIKLTAVTQYCNPAIDRLTDQVEKIFIKMAEKKSASFDGVRNRAMGIEELCESTGMPGKKCKNSKLFKDSDYHIASVDSIKKLEKYEETGYQYIPKGYKEVIKFEELKKNKNYMAVVHIDGNSMGLMHNKIRAYYNEKYHEQNISIINDAYLEELRNFSSQITEKYQQTFNQLIKAFTNVYEQGEPFRIRKIVLAGDDVTFVTQGELGVEAARLFLEKISEKEIVLYDDEDIKLHACAGVALGKTNYPFYKLYELAEQLCSNAKKELTKDNLNATGCLIDWHLKQGDQKGALSDIRNRYYYLNDNCLTLKPYWVAGTAENKVNRYQNFINALAVKDVFEKHGIGQNKIKEIRNVSRYGKSITESYIREYNLTDYFKENNQNNDIQFDDGNVIYTTNNENVYFDAIEIMDYFERIEEQ